MTMSLHCVIPLHMRYNSVWYIVCIASSFMTFVYDYGMLSKVSELHINMNIGMEMCLHSCI